MLKASCHIVCKIIRVKHNTTLLSVCSRQLMSDAHKYTFVSFYRHVDSVIQCGPRYISVNLSTG